MDISLVSIWTRCMGEKGLRFKHMLSLRTKTSCPDVFTNSLHNLPCSLSPSALSRSLSLSTLTSEGAEGDAVMFVTFSQQDDILWVCLSTRPIKQQNYSKKRGGGRKKKTPVYMWGSDFVEENPWFQNEPLADVGRALSPPRAGWDPLRVSSMWHKLNLSWRFLGSCFLRATQSLGGTSLLVQKVKGNTLGVLTRHVQKQRAGRESSRLEVAASVC